MELHAKALVASPATSASCQPCGRCPKAPYGGIGRRARLKIEFRKELVRFRPWHQKLFRSDPPASAKGLFEPVIGLCPSPLAKSNARLWRARPAIANP
jgi:hypothetical protein